MNDGRRLYGEGKERLKKERKKGGKERKNTHSLIFHPSILASVLVIFLISIRTHGVMVIWFGVPGFGFGFAAGNPRGSLEMGVKVFFAGGESICVRLIVFFSLRYYGYCS